MVRDLKGDSRRIRINVTVETHLVDNAKTRNINMSEVLNDALNKMFSDNPETNPDKYGLIELGLDPSVSFKLFFAEDPHIRTLEKHLDEVFSGKATYCFNTNERIEFLISQMDKAGIPNADKLNKFKEVETNAEDCK